MPCEADTMTVGFDRTECVCVPGFEYVDSSCVPCDAGYYKAAPSNDECVMCDVDFFSSGGASECTPCPLHEVTDGMQGQTVCLCEAAFERRAGVCEPCSAGAYKADAGDIDCTNCDVDSFASAGGEEHCHPCPANETTNNLTGQQYCVCVAGLTRGATACEPCAVGTAKADAGDHSCEACAVDNIAEAGALQCEPCASTTGTVGDNRVACVCSAGYERDAATLACTHCPEGFFKDAPADEQQCVACPAAGVHGYDRDSITLSSGSTNCTECRENSGVVDNNHTRCFCDAGYEAAVAVGDTTTALPICTPCEVGTFNAARSDAVCQPCAANTYAAAVGTLTCTPCPQNESTSDLIGSSACVCVSGFSRELGVCVACAADTFKSVHGDQACALCPDNEGTDTVTGLTACVCSPGYTRVEGSCEMCSTGMFKPTFGDQACVPCAENYVAPDAGAQVCSICVNNQQTTGDDRTLCVCPVGYGSTSSDGSQEPGLTSRRRLLAASSSQPNVWYKFDDSEFVGRDSVSGAIAQVNGVTVDSTSALPAVAEGCEAAAYFDGSANLKPTPFEFSNAAVTMSVWFRADNNQVPGTFDSAKVIELKSEQTYGARLSFYYYYHKWYAGINSVADSQLVMVALEQPEWVHVGFRVSGGGEWTITANGLEQFRATVGTFTPATYDIAVFGGSFANSQYFTGHLRDLRFFNAALGDAEFFALHTTTLEYCTSQPSVQPHSAEATATTACVPCEPGTFNNMEDHSACDACAADTFAAGNGTVQCLPCVGNSSTGDATKQSACTCLAGFEPLGETCEPCMAGLFKPSAGNHSCEHCAANSFSVGAAVACDPCPTHEGTGTATGQAACACVPGFGRVGEVCEECEAGTFRNSFANVLCEPCASNTTSVSGAIECASCDANEVTIGTDRTSCVCVAGYEHVAAGCVACALGTYKPQPGNDVLCVMCPHAGAAGYAQDSITLSIGASSCTECSLHAGVLHHDHTQCFCDAGYAEQDDPASPLANCAPCAAGTFKPVRGSDACTSCLDDSTSGAGSAACSACPADEVVVSNVCLCLAGRMRVDGVCQVCAVGHFKGAAGDEACAPCDADSFADAVASSNCTACPDNSDTNGLIGQTTCLCAQGFQPANPLADGETLAECAACAAGAFKVGIANAPCEACSPDTFSAAPAAVACTPCRTFSTTSGLEGATFCECVPGYAFHAADGLGAATCEPCEPGSFKEHARNESCAPCAAITYSALPGATACEDCQASTSTVSTASVECACDAGYEGVSTPAGHNCTQCPVGHFKSAIDDGLCAACAPGTFASEVGLLECVSCPVDTFANGTGAAACTSCGNNSYAAPGAAQCTCADGWVSSTTYLDHSSHTDEEHDRQFYALGEECVPCPEFYCVAGQYQDGVLACAPCPAFSNSSDGALFRRACECWPGYGDPGNLTCVGCAVGFYKNWYAMEACRVCPPGETTGAQESTACVCRPGFGRDAAETGLCSACAPGTFKAELGDLSCEPCVLNTFARVAGAASCDACPSGTVTLQTGAAACVCAQGYGFADGATACAPCPPGFFKDSAANVSCVPCPVNTSQPAEGRTQCEPCLANAVTESAGGLTCSCVPGFEMGADGACQLCAPGTARAATDAAACAACAANTSAPDAGSVACTPCGAASITLAEGAVDCVCVGGWALDSATGACVMCPLNTFKPDSGDDNCSACPENHAAQPGSLACARCPTNETLLEGTAACGCAAGHGLQDDGSCPLCAPGSNKSFAASVACARCPVDHYQPHEGALECLACESNSESSEGAAQCACAAGHFRASDAAGACVPCAAGSAKAEAGDAACTPCEPNTFAAAAGASQCATCPASSASASGAVICLCDPGYGFNASTLECAACAANFSKQYQGNEACLPCHAGSESLRAATACICSAGNFLVELEECAPCEPGLAKTAAGDDSCLLCDAGFFTAVWGSVACAVCPSFSESDSGAEDCLCSPKYGYNASTEQCGSCPEDTYKATLADEKCTPCHAGSVNRADALHCVCAAGWFLLADGVCAPCEVGFAKSAVGNESCDACAANFYAAVEGAQTCDACAAFSVSGRAAGECLCVPGYGPGAASGECVACAADTFKNTTANDECLPCPANAESLEGATECYCAAGHELTATGACAPCAPGAGKPAAGNEACTLCAADTFSAEAGSTACDPCAEASVAGEGASECLCAAGYELADAVGGCSPCPTNSHKMSQGNEGCTPCHADAVNADALSYCECAPGHYRVADGVCAPCEPGLSKAVVGNGTCTACAADTFAAVAAAVACATCPENTTAGEGAVDCVCVPGHGYDAAQQSCPACLDNTYKTSTADETCAPCHNHSEREGNWQHCLCSAGHFLVADGMCAPCAAGSAKSAVGNESCSSCEANFFASEGAEACARCPPFSVSTEGAADCECLAGYGLNASTQQCTPCSVGTFKTGVANTACLPCNANAESVEAATVCVCSVGYFLEVGECVPCGPGSAKNVLSDSPCVACSNGTFAAAPGSAVCDACGPFSVSAFGASTCNCTFGYDAAGGDCQPCAPGSAKDNERDELCAPCVPGTFQPDSGAVECEPCPGFAAASLQGSVDCACAAGTTLLHDQCVACAAGTFKGTIGAEACTPCPLGTFSGGNATACAVCSNSSSTAAPGSTRCECVSGFERSNRSEPQANGSECAPCSPGYARAGLGDGACTACAENFFAFYAGSEACTACPGPEDGEVFSRYVTAGVAASECVCAPGRFRDPVAARCMLCAAGTYHPNASTDPACSECGEHMVAPRGAPSCVCAVGAAPGNAPNATATQCVLCAPPLEKPDSGNHSCRLPLAQQPAGLTFTLLVSNFSASEVDHAVEQLFAAMVAHMLQLPLEQVALHNVTVVTEDPASGVNSSTSAPDSNTSLELVVFVALRDGDDALAVAARLVEQQLDATVDFFVASLYNATADRNRTTAERVALAIMHAAVASSPRIEQTLSGFELELAESSLNPVGNTSLSTRRSAALSEPGGMSAVLVAVLVSASVCVLGSLLVLGLAKRRRTSSSARVDEP